MPLPRGAGGLVLPAVVGGTLFPALLRGLRGFFLCPFLLPAVLPFWRAPCPFAGGMEPAMTLDRLCFPALLDAAGYLTPMLAMPRPARKASTQKCP